VGQRSSTETVVAILKAFLDVRTWKQADLARHIGVQSATLHKRLVELRASGIPLDDEREHPHVFWSVPKSWYPGGVLFTSDQVTEMFRQLPPSKQVFFVSDPDAGWVSRNLMDAMDSEEVPGGIRVTVETSAPKRLARFVVGLGGAAKPLTADLEREVAALAAGALEASGGRRRGRRSRLPGKGERRAVTRRAGTR